MLLVSLHVLSKETFLRTGVLLLMDILVQAFLFSYHFKICLILHYYLAENDLIYVLCKTYLATAFIWVGLCNIEPFSPFCLILPTKVCIKKKNNEMKKN